MDERTAVLTVIISDLERDIRDLDGRPFTAAVLSGYLGQLAAQVHTIAEIVQTLIPEDEDGASE